MSYRSRLVMLMEDAPLSLGPYRLEPRIASGGMGIVYRGRHELSGEAVAVKALKPGAPERVAAFRREVQVLSGLSHPGIVRFLDQGLSHGVPWCAMALVRGQPLSSLLNDRVRSPRAEPFKLVLG